MIGSTMRAAPSTMSSGGWKRCSAVLRSAMSTGSSSLTQPVSTLFMWMPSAWYSAARRARHHVERGLGHVGVRVLRGLEPPVELPLDRRHVDDVLVALGRAQHQRLEPRVEHERRDRVHQLGLEQLDRRHLGEHEPPRVPVAQVDLLQVLVEPTRGEQVAAAATPRRGAAAALRQRRGGAGASAVSVRRSPRTRKAPTQRARPSAGIRVERRRSRAPSCAR